MKFLIPTIGYSFTLSEPWTFTLHRESRNSKFVRDFVDGPHIGLGPIQYTLPAGTELKVDRIYIRQRKPEFDSVSLRMKGGRFWVKLADVNSIVFLPGFPVKPKAFRLEHRYQDSAWMPLDGEEYDDQTEAVARASELCKDSIRYGMTRVLCGQGTAAHLVVQFPAGGHPPC